MGRAEFDPYGNVIANTIPLDLTDRLFTGQRFDPNTGLYDYRARFYDPLTGSFVQPDSIVPSPMDPRAWNRFSYVYGNPVNYTDPSGHNPLLRAITGGIGAILTVGSKICSMPGGCIAGYLDSNYSIGQRATDLGIGFAAGWAGYGIASWGGPTASTAVRLGRVGGFGVLSVGESMALAYVRGDPYTTNDMAWAFGTGLLFGGFGEGVSGRVRTLLYRKGSPILAWAERRLEVSVTHRINADSVRRLRVEGAMNRIRQFGLTPSRLNQVNRANAHPVPELDLLPFEVMTVSVWASRQIFNKAIYIKGFRDDFEVFSPNPRVLFEGDYR